jgi:hypothetical protein
MITKGFAPENGVKVFAIMECPIFTNPLPPPPWHTTALARHGKHEHQEPPVRLRLSA